MIHNRYSNSNQNDRFLQALADIQGHDEQGAQVIDFSLYKARRMLRAIEEEYFHH